MAEYCFVHADTARFSAAAPHVRSRHYGQRPVQYPDNPPLTEADLAHLKPLPKARALRIRLRLTQEEFAARDHIPLGTLRNWEQRWCVLRDGPRRASSG